MWWSAAGLLVVAELLTGTFYLLMLSVGLAAAALAAQAGLTLSGQLGVAAVAGGLGVIGVRLFRRQRPEPSTAAFNRDVNLDIGQRGHVDHWNEEGTARVQYRGARWTALSADPAERAPGPHRVREVVGNRLVLERL